MSGILNHSPADILRHALIAEAEGSLPTGDTDWPIYVSAEPDSPDECITLYDTSGTLEGRYQIDGQVCERYGIQIRLRCRLVNDGYDKLAAIQNSLDTAIRNVSVTIGSDSYTVWTFSRTGSIASIGREEGTSNRRLLTLNGTVSITSN